MIATYVNLSALQPLKLDQLTEGSCVAEVFAENINFIQTTAHLAQIEASEQFAYNTGRIAEGHFPADSGLSSNEVLIQAMPGNYGILPASAMPFNPNSVGTYPTSAQLSQATQAHITGYTQIALNPDDMMANIKTFETFLTAGTPIEVAINIQRFFWYLKGPLDQQLSNISWTSSMYDQMGRHKIYLLGFDVAHDYFIAKQSWGPTIGDANQLIAIPRSILAQETFAAETINGLSGALGTVDVMHAANRSITSELYVELLNRAADHGGMAYWSGQLDAGTSPNAVADTIVSITPLASLSNADYVHTLYIDALGRSDASGEAYWTGQLATNSRGTIAMQIATAVMSYVGTDSAALTSQALFQNKVLVSDHYAIDMAVNDTTVAATIIGQVTADVNSAPTEYLAAAHLMGWV
jgi:hypothetical protein